MSMDALITKIKEKNNPTVMGLDPKLDFIPGDVKAKSFTDFGVTAEGAADALLKFNKGLIDATCDIIPCVKPQSAYYEMYGWQGVKALTDTISYARSKGMYVITDAKRGDIGATSEAYAKAYLGNTNLAENHTMKAFGGDSLTVNPYLGTDGVAPFVAECEANNKSIFVLVKTSNKSSGELQDLLSDGTPIYEHMAGLVKKWGETTIGELGYSGVGAVVGATYPEQGKRLRELLPNTYFLVPGYGAQGGGAKDVANCFNTDGLGAIVNASRSIMCAYQKTGEDYMTAARNEAIRMRDDILSVI